MKKDRPVNLDLRTIQFPLPAIASILHRISGVILFLLIPILLWFLQISLQSAADFASARAALDNIWLKLCVWGFLAALVYHLLAGIRHMIMDMGYGESLQAGRRSAYGVFLLSIIFIVILGIKLCSGM